jgi:hypothetical protein
MYSSILAKRPFAQHQPFEIVYADYTLSGVGLESGPIAHFVKANYNGLIYTDDLDAIRQGLQAIPPMVASYFAQARIDRVTLRRAIYTMRPYPASPEPVISQAGMVGSWDRQSGFLGVSARRGHDPVRHSDYLEVMWAGLANPQFRLGYVLNFVGPPKPLEVRREGTRLYYHSPEPGQYFFLLYVTDANLGTEEQVFAGPTDGTMVQSP